MSSINAIKNNTAKTKRPIIILALVFALFATYRF
jgi:hypothetical protein